MMPKRIRKPSLKVRENQKLLEEDKKRYLVTNYKQCYSVPYECQILPII